MPQQQGDAPALVAESALHHGVDPGAPGERYQVVVHVDADVLRDENVAARGGRFLPRLSLSGLRSAHRGGTPYPPLGARWPDDAVEPRVTVPAAPPRGWNIPDVPDPRSRKV